MIKRLHVQNYKALRDVTLDLTPIHVLIGQNDSGKTSVVNALMALSRSTDHLLAGAFIGGWEGRELVWQGDKAGLMRLALEFEIDKRLGAYSLGCHFFPLGQQVTVTEEAVAMGDASYPFKHVGGDRTRLFAIYRDGSRAPVENEEATRFALDAMTSWHSYRWNPRMLALPAAADDKRQFQMNFDGFGLAQFLDDIVGEDRDRFSALERRFCAVFPEHSSIKLRRKSGFRAPSDNVDQVSRLDAAPGKGLYFALAGSDQAIPASQASDGVLIVLAYLALLYSPRQPRMLLIEEPENGIHPKRLQDVITILRELVQEQTTTQILMTTHSPYLLDLFQPDEVTVCTKDDDGAVTLTRLSDSETVRKQIGLFNLGEIWTSEGESALVDEGAATSAG